MTSPSEIYGAFLGRWVLIPESCDYQQGDPPQSGSYLIAEEGGRLRFDIEWTLADGQAQKVTFSGVPDGKLEPFAGGRLADALSITAVSARELNSSAYWQGKELMLAQRQLDDTGSAMRITQLVRFPDGTTLANVGIYRKVVLN